MVRPVRSPPTVEPMRTHTLTDGRTSYEVCPISLGTMYFGTRVDEATSFAVLDRYLELGGTFVDTADCYAFWADGGTGAESEELIGRWLADRGVRDDVVLASKVSSMPRDPARPYSGQNRQGLFSHVIRRQTEQSLRRLGTDRLDVLFAHSDSRQAPLEESVAALGALVGTGSVGMLGASNHTTWRIERFRAEARRTGVAGYGVVQQRGTYLEERHPRERPTDAIQIAITPELLDYARSEPPLTVMAYAALIEGAYVRDDRPLPPGVDTPGAHARLQVLRKVADELGATPNQVVLAWLMGGDPPVLPVLGASRPEQVTEAMAALDLVLDDDVRARLDEA